MFSKRLPANLTTNELTEAVAKYRRSGRPLVDLTETNPTRAAIDYPDDLLAPLAGAKALTYAPSAFGSLDARRAVAADYERQGLTIAPERIVLTASTSEAYSLLFKLLADPGDEVLVPRPSYPLFDHLTALDAVAARPYDIEYHGRWAIDVDSVERALSPRTRALLIVSPNNPTGSFVRADELVRLVEISAARGIAIVVDEVFAGYELETGAAAAAGRGARVSGALTFTLGGLSKSIGLPQAKLGWIAVSGPPDRVDEALRRLEIVCDTYLSVGTPVQVAAAELLRRGAPVRSQIAARVRENYRALQSAAEATPSCSMLRTEGGWSAVLQVPTLESEEALVLRLLEDGVLVHPGYFFDFPRESFLVLSLLPPAAAFADGIRRVLRHFDCTTSAGRHV